MPEYRLNFVPQAHLEAALDPQMSEVTSEGIESIADGLGDRDTVVLLLDQSGSAVGSFQGYARFAQRVAEDAQTAGKQVAVYGFSAGGHYPNEQGRKVGAAGDDLVLLEYKGVGSDSTRTLAALPHFGVGGTPTVEALEELARRHAPGALVAVLTDGAAFDQKPARGPGVVRDLRAAGYAVVALYDDEGRGGRMMPAVVDMFGPDLATVNGRDPSASVAALRQLVAELGLEREERTVERRLAVLDVTADYSGYTDQTVPNPYPDQVDTPEWEAKSAEAQRARMANGLYEVRDSDGQTTRALYREGQWFHEPDPRRPFDGKPVYPVPVEDAAVIAVLDEERAKYTERPTLETDVAQVPAAAAARPTIDYGNGHTIEH